MLRLGIIDFDSSHSIEFTRRFNKIGVDPDQYVEGARVVLGCPGVSAVAPERIETYRPQVAACGVELVERPEDLLGRVDAVLILSLTGAAHVARAELFLKRQVPVFIDKPVTQDVLSARKLAEIAGLHHTLVWTASGMRFSDDLQKLRSKCSVVGPIHSLISHGPGWRHAGNPGLLHYGIHAVEQAYALLGGGCMEVSCLHTAEADTVTGRWNNGRTATIHVRRTGSTAYGLLTFHEHGILHTATSTKNSYRNLCQAMVGGFTTGVAPVPMSESIEVIQFITAALTSEEQGGRPVPLS